MNEIEKLIEDSKAIVAVARKAGRDLTTIESAAVDANLKRVEMLKRSEKTTAETNAFFGRTFDSPSSGGHVALTGRHAKALADSIVRKIGDTSAKGLVAAGSQVVSTIVMPSIIEEGKPATSVLDVLPSRIVPSPVYSFVRQVSPRVPNAKVTPAGTPKSVTQVSVEAVTNQLQVIATLSERIDSYVLEDGAGGGDNLSSFLTSELVYALRVALEDEVVNGPGGAGHFTGLLNTSGIRVANFQVDVLTSVRKALTAMETSGYQAGVLLMSPGDWEALDLKAASQASVEYRSLPIQQSERRIWGTRVVVTTSLPAKTALLLGEGSTVIDTDGSINIKFSDSVGDSFERNQVVLRAESRWGLSCLQPGAIFKVGTAA